MEEFRDLIETLGRSRVEGVLIGGVAGALRGAHRPTRDVDFLYQRKPANYDRLVDAITPLQPYLRGAPPNLPFCFDKNTIAAGGNFTLTTTAGDLDRSRQSPAETTSRFTSTRPRWRSSASRSAFSTCRR